MRFRFKDKEGPGSYASELLDQVYYSLLFIFRWYVGTIIHGAKIFKSLVSNK